MARKPVPSFADLADDDVAVDDQPQIATDDTVNARVKGTWLMFWGNRSFDFKDGQRYRIPRDLFNYLKNSGNIYDTMA